MIITKSEPFTKEEIEKLKEKNETKLLVGSLSNDLFRVATLAQRGSLEAAERYLMYGVLLQNYTLHN